MIGRVDEGVWQQEKIMVDVKRLLLIESSLHEGQEFLGKDAAKRREIAIGLLETLINRVYEPSRRVRKREAKQAAEKVARWRVPLLEKLGLSADATIEDVKARYRQLARRHHPDLGGDARMFAALNALYEDAKDQYPDS